MASQMYEFGRYQLHPEEKLLLRDGAAVPLAPKAVHVLLVLVERVGQVVSKEELLRRAWPDTFVEEANLTQAIFVLRKALGDGTHTRYIETVPRRGYRFAATVNKISLEGAASPKESPELTIPRLTPQQHLSRPSAEGNWNSVPRAGRALRFLKWAAVAALFAAVAILSTPLWHRPKLSALRSSDLRKEAEKNYLEGRFFWKKRTEAGYRDAITHFEEALRLDPNYAEAYAGLADSYILLGSFGVEPLSEVIPKARAAAVRAIEINERSAEAHASMAYIMSRFEWNWDEAEREFRRAIELDPDYTTAHQWYSLHLVTMGRPAEAIAEIKTAQRLDPASPVLATDTALVLFYARRYDEALEQCQKTLRTNPAFGLAYRTMGEIYAAKGMPKEAIAELKRASKLLGTDPWTIAETGRSYAMLGDREQVLLELDELQQLSHSRFVSPIAFALLTAALPDRRDESFQWLEKEYDQHSNVTVLAVYPGFDPLRGDPRFQQLLRRIGLVQG